MPSPFGRSVRPLVTTIAVLLTMGSALPAAEISGGGGVARIGLKAPERVAEPKLAPASDDWQKAMKRFRVAPNFQVDLFAAEPMLGNPVAFTMDAQGRAFVSETYRYRSSTLDIRHYMFMLEDDLANRTTDDRIAEIKKNFPNEWEKLQIETEVVRLVEDRDKDGKADFSSAYAAGMNTLLDGINAGVLAHEGKVWCTNLPNLWLFSGMTQDGKAEKRESLSFGYGVRFSFTGHDMHGLILGPDGRLYFSFGDRGANVKTKEGGTLAFPDEGAIFRCEPDGSHMEVVMHGLRNPQELAFDKYGNLFTGDNDSDQGDRERWVYAADGGDAGWRVGWQHHPIGKDQNPWLAEKMWAPHFDGQAAYILPPVSNIPDGPSGLAYYPGTGMPAKFEDTFFLCGFKGSSARSAVSSWKVKPKGASFELVNQEVFIGDAQATDICFGPDSKIYFSEWGEGWEGTGKGRIFKMWDPKTIQDPQVAEVQKLLAEGFAQRSPAELGKLLAHGDQRIRLEAQWALAKKAGGDAVLLDVAKNSTDELARLHGIWGLGQIARLADYQQPGASARILDSIVSLLLWDKDVEVRTQAAKVLGEAKVPNAFNGLLAAVRDPSPRARFYATQALAKFGRADAIPAVVAMLKENNDQDQYLRHAGVMVLVAAKDTDALTAAAKDSSAAVRMAALLAMRRLESPAIAKFLQDKEPLLVLEAARAINDAPINGALPQLAALISQPTKSEPLMLRVINAAFRTGTPAMPDALAAYAGRPDVAESLRVEALRQLALWPKPAARDRVAGVFRPLSPRDGQPAVAAISKALPRLLGEKSTKLAEAAVETVAALDARNLSGQLAAYVDQNGAPVKARIKALQTLAAFNDPKLPEAVKHAVSDKEGSLRVEALAILGKLNPEEAGRQLGAAFGEATPAEKKVIITALGDLKSAAADRAVAGMLGDLIAGKVPAEIQLELIEAAEKRKSPEVKAKLDAYHTTVPKDSPLAWQPVMAGGDREAGEKLFKEHAVAQCFRCHKVNGSGGDAGPELTKVAASKDRAYILESIVNPNAKIAEGFQMAMITTKKGDLVAGLVRSETPQELTLQMPGAEPVKVPAADIAKREAAPSGMPPGFGDMLTKRELRDIVEYVANLK